MKTIYSKSIFTILVIVLATVQGISQNMVSTRIDVQGSRYGDQMWVFAVPSCTRDFDNGWDAFKMFGTSTLIPQIFAMETNGNFQIDAVPTLNETYIAFKAGEDTTYTLTFNNEYLETMYTGLFLVDLETNQTVNVTATGSKYTFTVHPTAEAVKRFKLMVNLTVVTPPTSGTDTTSTDTINTTPTTPTDSIVTPPTTDSKNKEVKIKIHGSKKDVVVENNGKHKGQIKVYSATTGKLVKTANFNAKGKTIISTTLQAGSYIVKASAETDTATANILIK